MTGWRITDGPGRPGAACAAPMLVLFLGRLDAGNAHEELLERAGIVRLGDIDHFMGVETAQAARLHHCLGLIAGQHTVEVEGYAQIVAVVTDGLHHPHSGVRVVLRQQHHLHQRVLWITAQVEHGAGSDTDDQAIIQFEGHGAFLVWQHRANADTVAQAHIGLAPAAAAEVLAEGTGPGQQGMFAEFSDPVRVVIAGIMVDGLLNAAVHAQIALLVTEDTEQGHLQGALAGLLVDGAEGTWAGEWPGAAGEQAVQARTGREPMRGPTGRLPGLASKPAPAGADLSPRGLDSAYLPRALL
ncbi:hypothetical protein WR25_23503 [Diploscapter pachys]|uniref:Uncharacterized protein n=1 Tax=Diploscapter pachys TaxID=2018661 RepID=A0A2A2K8F7_9BILA|nr:hypothetical protein WR25_23503 [Diploscapter pachys]